MLRLLPPSQNPTQQSSAAVAHLLSPIYMGAIAGLLLNDHVLKQSVPGLITGKLSDFLGLFALAVFLSVMLPRRTLAIHVSIGMAFIAWKSPFSDIMIQTWNTTMPFRLARVVDYWDLLALFVLPISVVYLRREWPALAPASARAAAVITISLFAFTATSRASLRTQHQRREGIHPRGPVRSRHQGVRRGTRLISQPRRGPVPSRYCKIEAGLHRRRRSRH
jgi:hypothetical protein